MTDKIHPGMSHVCSAGETLVIRDSVGDEIAVEAREHPATVAFLCAFDEWRSARRAGVTGVVLDTLARTMESAYANLPPHVSRTLPSASGLGVRLQPR